MTTTPERWISAQRHLPPEERARWFIMFDEAAESFRLRRNTSRNSGGTMWIVYLAAAVIVWRVAIVPLIDHMTGDR